MLSLGKFCLHGRGNHTLPADGLVIISRNPPLTILAMGLHSYIVAILFSNSQVYQGTLGTKLVLNCYIT